jgi:ectoine hydroxylase-related dioxygenase (phytanoyl-CoA dioxygenase family)
MNDIEYDGFNNSGFAIIKDFISLDLADLLRSDLIEAIQTEAKHLADLCPAMNDRLDNNMVHNAFLYSKNLMDVLNTKKLRVYTDLLLCKNAIVYAYQTSSAPPFQSNYGRRIHVDAPRFIPGYRTNLGFILALNDFTEKNGGTEALPGSHKAETLPSGSDFDQEKVQLVCKKGDAIFFDARLWHRTGQNHTDQWRHALSINFCRPYMRTRFDFPRMPGISKDVDFLESQAAKYLGFDVRMPIALDEFYLPEEERLYKPGQE